MRIRTQIQFQSFSQNTETPTIYLYENYKVSFNLIQKFRKTHVTIFSYTQKTYHSITREKTHIFQGIHIVIDTTNWICVFTETHWNLFGKLKHEIAVLQYKMLLNCLTWIKLLKIWCCSQMHTMKPTAFVFVKLLMFYASFQWDHW